MAFFVTHLELRLTSRWSMTRRRLVGGTIALVILAPLLASSLGTVLARFDSSDTRVVATSWFETTVPPGSTVLHSGDSLFAFGSVESVNAMIGDAGPIDN